jgi:hypothetical protein
MSGKSTKSLLSSPPPSRSPTSKSVGKKSSTSLFSSSSKKLEPTTLSSGTEPPTPPPPPPEPVTPATPPNAASPDSSPDADKPKKDKRSFTNRRSRRAQRAVEATSKAEVAAKQEHPKLYSERGETHDIDSELREPKGWTLSHVLSKATASVGLSKVFAPHISLADPNRVKVGVRIRPLSENEMKRGETKAGFKEGGYIKMGGTQIRIINPRPPPGQDAKEDNFAFDQLYGPEVTTTQVFKDLALPLVHGVVDGFNGTIFAYGQTGSGKTHSIMGSDADPGVTPRTVVELFEVLKRMEGTFEVKASYLQIYREILHDLLSGTSLSGASSLDRDTKADLKIRRDPERGIYVQNLSEVPLSSGDELAAVIEQGNKRRATSATLMNAASSRSHAVVILHLHRHEPPSGKK